FRRVLFRSFKETEETSIIPTIVVIQNVGMGDRNGLGCSIKRQNRKDEVRKREEGENQTGVYVGSLRSHCARNCARDGLYTTSRHPPSPYEFPHAGGAPSEERALIITDNFTLSAPLYWRPQWVRFLHCHGRI